MNEELTQDHEHDVIECIKEMTRLAKEGKIVSVDFWLHESSVQLTVFEMLAARKPDEPVFGGSQDELEEMCDALQGLCVALGIADDNPEAMRGPVSSVMLAMLMKMLVGWIVDKANSGELGRILLELIEKLTQRDA